MVCSSLFRGWVLVGAVSLAPLGCARSLAPTAPTAAEATGRSASSQDPLVVDWRPEARADLEVAMREGLPVAKPGPHGLELIHDCWVDGSYSFVGTSLKEEVVRVRDMDALRAVLPQTAATQGASFEAAAVRGASLDVALAMVGKNMSTLRTVRPDQLRGRCEGATHFVRSATLGAFAMNTGSTAETRAVAEVFGASAGAESSHARSLDRRDGNLEACRGAAASAAGAPDHCAAVLRLRFAPIDDPLPPGIAVDRAPSDAGTSATDPSEYSCEPGDLDDCMAKCDRGDAGACFIAAASLQAGVGVPADANRASQLHRRACDLGSQNACVMLGITYLTGPEYPEGVKLLERACELNNPHGCMVLAKAYYEGNRPDPARARGYAQRGCRLGNQDACAMLKKHGG